jgi:coenzyme PQQ precursor peptide PqqA
LGLGRRNWKACRSHKFFIPIFIRQPCRGRYAPDQQSRPRDRENADVLPVCAPQEIPRNNSLFALQKWLAGDQDVKISLAKFSPRATLWIYLMDKGGNPINQPTSQRRRAKMAWKAPKIVEVPVGMEINMYACAARK